MPSVEPLTSQDAVTITPSDATIVNCDAIYVGVGGNVAVVTAKGTTVTFVGVPTGTILPQKCQKIMSTNTTATTMLGLKY
jgi:hypothetical protein